MRKTQVGMGRGERGAWRTEDQGGMLKQKRMNVEELGNERNWGACCDIPDK